MNIYKLTSPSGKVYIGQTKNTIELRWNQHIRSWERWKRERTKKGGSTKLYFALDKYPPENWKIEILCKCSLREELDEKEEYYIQSYNSIEDGYNITKGGSGRKVDFFDEDHKKNLSNARKEYFNTDEGLKWKEELSKKYSDEGNPMYGKVFDHTEETKKDISEKMKGKNLGKEPWNKGKEGVYSNETTDNISKTQKKRHAEGKYDHIDYSLKMKGKKQTEKQKEAVSLSNGKTWIITDPNGNESEIFSLNKFCGEMGLDTRNIQSKSGSKKYKARKK